MKILKLSNGEIRKGYELNDLSSEVRNEVINSHIDFLNSMPIECEDEDGNMQDEYFEHNEADAIESIEINRYLYDEDGEILPTLYHHDRNNNIVKVTFGKNQHEVEFI